jgi:hypothetical protein
MTTRKGHLTHTTCEPSLHDTHMSLCRARRCAPWPATEGSPAARRVVAIMDPHFLHTSAVAMSEHVMSLEQVMQQGMQQVISLHPQGPRHGDQGARRP